jgi:hypothetical protein
MHFSDLAIWRTDLSLGAKVLWTLTAPDRPALEETLRESLEEALRAAQGRLGVYEAELLEAGF